MGLPGSAQLVAVASYLPHWSMQYGLDRRFHNALRKGMLDLILNTVIAACLVLCKALGCGPL
jgi:hypothetical protein